MPFDAYPRKGLLKRQSVNLKQIEKQIIRAKRDLDTARFVLGQDPEWAATIAYQSMLRAGRALIFSKGFLPADGAQPLQEVLEVRVEAVPNVVRAGGEQPGDPPDRVEHERQQHHDPRDQLRRRVRTVSGVYRG